MANVSALLLFSMCCRVYELQRRDVKMAGVPFSLKGGPAIQLLAAAGIVWLLMQATEREWKVQALALAAASGYYLLKGRIGRMASAASASPAPDR